MSLFEDIKRIKEKETPSTKTKSPEFDDSIYFPNFLFPDAHSYFCMKVQKC